MHSKNYKDLTNQRFGKWKILQDSLEKQRRDPIWICQCDCGTIRKVSGNSLRNGSKSCGCFKPNRKYKSKIRSDVYAKEYCIYCRYRIEARKRNLIFNLTFNDFLELIFHPCYYCGKEKTNKQKMRDGNYLFYNGIDRVDNTIGYLLNNCVACCRNCNVRKRSVDLNMIYKILEFLNG